MSDISAARYNNLQARIQEVMGTGSGTTGYGQILQSYQIFAPGGNTEADIVDADHMINLYADMIKARVHQVGPPPPNDIAQVTDTDLVYEDDPVGKTGIVQFENFMTILENDKLLVDTASQTTTEAAGGISNTRTTEWNGTVTHEFTVTFNDANHRRHFFNAGGEILFSANITGGSGDKTLNWRAVLENMGTIRLNYTRTTTSAPLPNSTITTTNIGNYDLTGNYQIIFTKTATGTYSANDYTIKAKELNATSIQFRVEFNDDAGPNPNLDENVNGVLASNIQLIRPTGTNVEVVAPAFTNISTL